MPKNTTNKAKDSLKIELQKNLALRKELTRLRKLLTSEQKINQKIKQKNDKFTHSMLLREEEGRRSISRELHDQVAQILTGINFELAILIKEATTSGRHLLDRIYDTQKLVEQSVETVHQFAKELRPMILDDLGLVPALKSYFADFQKKTSIPIDFSFSPQKLQLDDPGKTALFRVVQESLNNVAKHARAKKVKIRLKKSAKGVYFKIEDNGVGFDSKKLSHPKSAHRIGLLGMKERIKLVGGELDITSSKPNGTAISGSIPQKLPTKKSKSKTTSKTKSRT